MKYSSISLEDISSCAKIFCEVFNNPPWNENWVLSSAIPRLKETFEHPGFFGLKADSDSKIVGFVMGYTETWHEKKHYYLKEMCVIPEKQRRGIGSSLLDELKKHLIYRQGSNIYLLTLRDSQAQSFYAKNGFYVSDTMIVMGLSLKPSQ